MLELYRRLRLRSPHVSIQSWVRVLCDIHNVCCSVILLCLTQCNIFKVNYRRYLRTVYSGL